MSGGVYPFRGILPRLGERVFLAASAYIVGDVNVAEDSGFWFNTVVRGDVNSIRIGAGTNVQDGAVLHVTTDRFPLSIGNGVSIGHGAVVHGCTIEDDCLIGIGSVVLDGVSIGKGSIIAAGALVPEGAEIPPGHLVMGIPAKPVRAVREDEGQRIIRTADKYVELKDIYLKTRKYP